MGFIKDDEDMRSILSLEEEDDHSHISRIKVYISLYTFLFTLLYFSLDSYLSTYYQHIINIHIHINDSVSP